jgi:cytochrome c-type biogenesis protein CcmH/NrfG
MKRFRHAGPESSACAVAICAVALALFVFLSRERCRSQVADSATIQGTILNPQGTPVSGATVLLQFKEDANTLKAKTDASGKYRFTTLRKSAFTISVVASGFVKSTSNVVSLQTQEVRTVDFKLDAAKSAGSPGDAARPNAPEFFDEPHFSVAGVTDTTNLGGHGSDTVVRTREALSKDTSSLGSDAKPASTADAASYESEKRKVQGLLAHSESADLHHSLADIDEKLNNPLDAVHEYECAAEMSPSEGNLFDWGSELLLHHAPEPALEVFQKGHRLFPQSVRMLLGTGAAWYAHGSFDLAVHSFREASDLEPANPTPYLFLGRTLMAETQSSPELMDLLKRFVTLHPEDARAHYYYALGLWKRRTNFQDAQSSAQIESHLANAIRLDPRFSEAHLQLGILYTEQKELSNALKEFERAVEIDPNNEEAHYRLSQAFRQHDEPDKAKAELKVYDELEKKSAERNERERHEIQQFVYTLRDQPSTAPAK